MKKTKMTIKLVGGMGLILVLLVAGAVWGMPNFAPTQSFAPNCIGGASSGVTIAFAYDNAGRLTDADMAGGTTDYTYDNNGNLLQRQTGGFAVAPSLDISKILGGVQVAWVHTDAANISYEVWRDTVPCFDPDNAGVDTTLLGTATPPAIGQTKTFDDLTGVAGTTYYYVVRGVATGGHKAEGDNRVAVFHFDIEPGS